MSMFNCSCKFSCTAAAFLASLVVGVLAAFFQITAVITVTPAFLWVALGIAVVYLGVLAGAAVLSRRAEHSICTCSALNTVLLAILGTILFAVVLLGVGIVATSVISAILIGLLLFFAALIFTSTACLIRCLFQCND